MDRRKFICETLKFIDENFSSKMVLDELAKISGYSVPQFSRLFTEFTGITPMRYVNVIRIQNSTNMLSKTDKSITEIAFACGFDTLEVFERSFKKYFGISASEYRSGCQISATPFYLSEQIYYESLKDNLLTDIANTNLDVMVSVNIAPVDPYKALKIVNHQLTSMRANKLQAEKKAIQSGYTSDVINEDLKHSLIEAEELLDDLRSKNQKMFLNNVIIMVTAKDFDELENNTETIEAVVRKHICSVSTLKFQ